MQKCKDSWAIEGDFLSFLQYKCPELKSNDFKPQEKRERKIGKSAENERKKESHLVLNMYAVRLQQGGGGRGGNLMYPL